MLKPLAVLGKVNGIGRGADDGNACRLQRPGQLQGRLPAVLDDDAVRFLHVHDLQHVFKRQRLEIEAVRGIEIGGHRLRVAVDHDGLEPLGTQRKGSMHAAIIELDPLSDPVGAAAEHDDLLALAGLGLAMLLVGGVHVGGAGGEFGSAGIHSLVHGPDAHGVTNTAHGALIRAHQLRQSAVGKPFAFQRQQLVRAQRIRAAAQQQGLFRHQVFQLGQKPRVDTGELLNLLQGQPLAETFSHIQQALGAGVMKLL